MECEEIRVDLRRMDPRSAAESQRCAKLMFQLNHTMPFTQEYNGILKELFGDHLGEGSTIAAPLRPALTAMPTTRIAWIIGRLSPVLGTSSFRPEPPSPPPGQECWGCRD